MVGNRDRAWQASSSGAVTTHLPLESAQRSHQARDGRSGAAKRRVTDPCRKLVSAAAVRTRRIARHRGHPRRLAACTACPQRPRNGGRKTFGRWVASGRNSGQAARPPPAPTSGRKFPIARVSSSSASSSGAGTRQSCRNVLRSPGSDRDPHLRLTRDHRRRPDSGLGPLHRIRGLGMVGDDRTAVPLGGHRSASEPAYQDQRVLLGRPRCGGRRRLPRRGSHGTHRIDGRLDHVRRMGRD